MVDLLADQAEEGTADHHYVVCWLPGGRQKVDNLLLFKQIVYILCDNPDKQ
jgi:hypothetical protein